MRSAITHGNEVLFSIMLLICSPKPSPTHLLLFVQLVHELVQLCITPHHAIASLVNPAVEDDTN